MNSFQTALSLSLSEQLQYNFHPAAHYWKHTGALGNEPADGMASTVQVVETVTMGKREKVKKIYAKLVADTSTTVTVGATMNEFGIELVRVGGVYNFAVTINICSLWHLLR